MLIYMTVLSSITSNVLKILQRFMKSKIYIILLRFMKSIMQFTVPENAEVNTAEGNIGHSLFKIFYY